MMGRRRREEIDIVLPQALEDRLAFSGLSADELDTVRAKAREHVAKEMRDKAEAAALQVAIKEERRRYDPAEASEEVIIDLPGHAPYIMLDGTQFFHAFTYTVRHAVACVLRDSMARAWEHEEEVGGANRDLYRKPRNLTLRPRDANVSASKLLGV